VVPNSPLPDPTPTVTVANPQPNTPLPTGDGIVCPLAGPFTHVDDFNAPRSVGGVHRASDLISAQGTPVLAAASGTIEHRNSSVGGLSAHLRGDNGDYYFYTHLLGYENVGVGYVAAGTVIGYVGMTGNAPIPHLHFEIHSGGYGNYSNPYERVREACF
jgi:murein DD-endopeptidase MepM/ murein hydrolase activator NlpD